MTGSGSGKKCRPRSPAPRIETREIVVELLGDVARQLEVLLLVLADRHVRGAVGQDVGRHQDRIGVEADGRVLAVLAGLLLELRHAIEPAEPGHAIEDPGQLGVLEHLALVEEDALLRDRARRPCRLRSPCGSGPCSSAGSCHTVMACMSTTQKMHSCVFCISTQLHHGAQIVAQMQVAGRLHAGEDARGWTFMEGSWSSIWRRRGLSPAPAGEARRQVLARMSGDEVVVPTAAGTAQLRPPSTPRPRMAPA